MEILKTITANGKTFHNVALCQCGIGEPTPQTVGQVGQLYMDTDSGDLYKCTAVSDGLATWEPVGEGGGGIYIVTAHVHLDQETEEEVYSLVDFDWDKLVEAHAQNKVIVCRVINTDSMAEDFVVASDYLLHELSTEENYADFTCYVTNVSKVLTVASDGSIVCDCFYYHVTPYFEDSQAGQAADAAAVGKALGDIETALDNIIAIQEELIGEFVFYLNGNEFTAKNSMTWDAWCYSRYNTIGAYVEDDTPCDNAGDAISSDGIHPVRGGDLIVPTHTYCTL